MISVGGIRMMVMIENSLMMLFCLRLMMLSMVLSMKVILLERYEVWLVSEDMLCCMVLSCLCMFFDYFMFFIIVDRKVMMWLIDIRFL